MFPYSRIFPGKDYSLAGGDFIWATVQKSDPLTLLPAKKIRKGNVLYCIPQILCCFFFSLVPLTVPSTSANANVCKHYATLCTKFFLRQMHDWLNCTSFEFSIWKI
jgi:hypothetical protein